MILMWNNMLEKKQQNKQMNEQTINPENKRRQNKTTTKKHP